MLSFCLHFLVDFLIFWDAFGLSTCQAASRSRVRAKEPGASDPAPRGGGRPAGGQGLWDPRPHGRRTEPPPPSALLFLFIFLGGAVRAGNFRAFALFVLVFFFFFAGLGSLAPSQIRLGLGIRRLLYIPCSFCRVRTGGSSHAWLEAERA